MTCQLLVHPDGIDNSRGLQCSIAWGSAVYCNAMQLTAMQRTAWWQVSHTAVDPCHLRVLGQVQPVMAVTMQMKLRSQACLTARSLCSPNLKQGLSIG